MKTTTLAVSILSMFFGFVGFGTAGAENIEDVRQFIQTKKCPGCDLSGFSPPEDLMFSWMSNQPFYYTMGGDKPYAKEFMEMAQISVSHAIDFGGADLRDANLNGAILRLNFESAKFTSAFLRAAHLKGNFNQADFRNADLSVAVIHGMFREANFSHANLNGVLVYVWTDFSKANLRGANLSFANLSSTDLSGADLRDAEIDGVILHSPKRDEIGASYMAKIDEATQMPPKLRQIYTIVKDGAVGRDLSNLDLSGAYLAGVDFSGANLSGTNLRNANLFGANFEGADLQNADFTRAILTKTNLQYANMVGANFNGAITYDANIKNSQVDYSAKINSYFWSDHSMTRSIWFDGCNVMLMPYEAIEFPCPPTSGESTVWTMPDDWESK
ncbi:pentapeptide repeat protein [Thalassoporum mexicanum PCC 7367]|uniref:pentapeptide repeat-containing protein n=1 Tax=Thalassoporum mexicanum TaxID=3457544 RepID=UPI00029FCF95|nr:pentapeptide repeat-containing protein [Pseudanabaena sp. PCC 7367]AFY70722.1 pentapeptide repeat protein [Pseudanabaena sp. PCC 7367]